MSNGSVVQFPNRADASELVSMIRMLPPLPDVAHKILDQFHDEFISGIQIAEIVSGDPAISARLFALANSAYFGLSTPVSDMREVVSRVLGPDTVRSLAFALATDQTFDLNSCKHFSAKRFWHRSLHCADAAQRIAAIVDDLDSKDRDFAYLTGLCHGLGLMVLACCYPSETDEIFERCADDEETNVSDLCVERFGFSIEEATFELARHWEMPAPIVESYRHCAQKEPHKNLLAATLGAAIKSARFSDKVTLNTELELPDFSEELPGVDAEQLMNASFGSDSQREATDSRLQAMMG